MSKTIIEFDNESGTGTHTTIHTNGEKTVRRMFITMRGEDFEYWEKVGIDGIMHRGSTGVSTLSITATLLDGKYQSLKDVR